MNNIKLMKKVIELYTQTLHTREQSRRVMVQCSIIRKAFQVKEGEIESKVLDFERDRVFSDQEVENEFYKYIGFWEWSIKSNDMDKAKSFENDINYFIDGVSFFDERLAQNFKELYVNKLKVA